MFRVFLVTKANNDMNTWDEPGCQTSRHSVCFKNKTTLVYVSFEVLKVFFLLLYEISLNANHWMGAQLFISRLLRTHFYLLASFI